MLTLSENPTEQEVYEYIRQYFSRPNAVLAKYEDEMGDRCVYRDDFGNKCAVGCLISDELYDSPLDAKWRSENGVRVLTVGEYIESKNVGAIADVPSLQNLVNGDSEEGQKKLEFLKYAQEAHDSAVTADAHDFVEKLDALASARGLRLVS